MAMFSSINKYTNENYEVHFPLNSKLCIEYQLCELYTTKNDFY